MPPYNNIPTYLRPKYYTEKARENTLKKYHTSDKDFNYFISTLPENLQYEGDFDAYRYWELNGKPKDFEEAKRKQMYVLEGDGWHARSAAYNEDTGEIEVLKLKNHPNLWMETMAGALNPELHQNYILNLRDGRFYYTPRKKYFGGKLNYLQFMNSKMK